MFRAPAPWWARWRQKPVTPVLVQTALERGLAALVTMQAEDGSFPLASRQGHGPWQPCHPIFATVTVLLSVGWLLPAQARARALESIRRCRDPRGWWEYDPALRIPADSDVTACALAVMALYGEGLTAPSDADVLRAFWREPNGPFRTWAATEGEWAARDRDDAVVNANVLMALSVLGARPTSSERSAALQLAWETEQRARYYCSPSTIGYALQRSGAPVAAVPGRLARRPTARGDILPGAQWLSMTRRWEEELIDRLLGAQAPDGSWAAEGWCTGTARVPIVWGSPAVSTALAAEALARVLSARTSDSPPSEQPAVVATSA